MRSSDDDTDLLALTQTVAQTLQQGGHPDIPAGTRIGRYRIDSVLGRGGMGLVLLAEQTEPIRRRVALKLVARTQVDRTTQLRFQIERQALARMAHPGIAQIFDAGSTADGAAWFAMEFVQGRRLDAWWTAAAPSVDEGVRLFRDLCRAVGHAHRAGVVHCDIKPANVLVTDIDGRPQPKVIDFGIARATGQLDPGEVLGTPDYISPEQAAGRGEVDARSDVHALGATLRELLTGRRLRGWLTGCENGAARVFARIATEGAPESAAEPLARLPLPRGRRVELAAIIDRALAHDPAARYEDAHALAEDLERWLQRQPVEAVPGTRRYRTACFLRRHVLAVGIGSVALLALLGGLVGTTLGLLEATAQRAAAEARERELETVVGFQQRLLGDLDARRLAPALTEELRARAGAAASGAGDTATLLESLPMVDATRSVFRSQVFLPAAEAIHREFEAAPRIAARLRTSLGDSLTGLALFADAERELDLALASFDALGDRQSRARIEAEIARAALDRAADRVSEAEQRLAALEHRMAHELAHDDPLQSEFRLARALVAADRGHPQASLADFAAAATGFRARGLVQRAIETEATGLIYTLVATSRCNLVDQAQTRRLADEARAAALDMARMPSLVRAVALCDMARGAVRAAAKHHGAFVAMQRRISGDEDPGVQMQRGMNLLLRTISGEPGDDLESELLDAEARASRLAGPETTYAVFPRIARGELLSRLGRHDEALALLRDLDRRLPEMPDVHPVAAMMVAGYLGMALARIDRSTEAEAAVQRAHASCVSMLGTAYADCQLYPIALARDRAKRDPTAWPSERLAALWADIQGLFSEGSPYPIVVGWLLHEALLREGRGAEADALLDGPLRSLAIPEAADVSLDDLPYVNALREALARR